MKWKYMVAWIPGIPIAVVNGMIRQFGFRRILDELPAHQLSVATFIILFGCYVWLIVPWLRFNGAAEAMRTGLVWLAMTVIFEFVFGYFIMGHAWAVLLHDYDVVAGRLWVVVLAWTCFSPVAMYLLRDSGTMQGF